MSAARADASSDAAPSLLGQRVLAPRAGARGVGDPYYPSSGNGGYDVGHYTLELVLDMQTGEIDAIATLACVATHDLSAFSLDLHGLELHTVAVNDRPAGFEREQDELVIEPPQPLPAHRPFVVQVAYGGVPEVVVDPGVPFAPGVGWMQTEAGIHVISECIGARSWFPCNDHPSDKATYSMRITVAKPYVAAANGVLSEEIDHGDRRTYVFQARDPMATYLATLNVAEFERRIDKTARGLPLYTYYPADATEAELAELARTEEMILFFETLFGAYPFESFGAVIAARQFGGALETQTLPVYSRGVTEGVVAHELAHQWFGDCVSPRRWSDLWLNEGFAVYAGWLWREHLEGSAELERLTADMHARLFEREIGPPADPGLAELFSARTYQRAGLVLHALRAELGERTFFRTLRAWVGRYHDAVSGTHEFIALCEEQAGRDLSDFFGAWLFADVLPPPEVAHGE